jgi:HlyD family secretion protein
MRKIPRRPLFALAALAVVVIVLLMARGSPVEVDLATASPDSLSVTIPVEGTTRARDLYAVTAPVTGRVARLDIEQGDTVEEGDLLARIFPTEQDARTLATLRAEVQSARGGVAEAESRVREAELQEVQARREVERRRPLAEMGAISAEAMEQVQLAAVAATQRLESARAGLTAARATLEGAQARLLGAESGQAGAPALPVTAPVSGRVLRITAQSERVVGAGEPLLELANTGGLEVVLDVLSEDAVRIEPGQELRITGWGGERVLTGSVRTVTLAGYTEVSALGVEEQRVDVYADLHDVPRSLGTGYRVSGEIVVWKGADVLTVPTSALFRSGNGWRLFVVEDGRARLRDVELGERNEEAVEIVRGVSAGERIIVYPSDTIEDGVRVRATSGASVSSTAP